MKLHCLTACALLSIAFTPSRAQDYQVPVIGGPAAYGAIYIDLSGTTSAFALTYLTQLTPSFSVAQYNESFAFETDWVAVGPNLNVSNMFDVLPTVNYVVSPFSISVWKSGAVPLTSFVGQSGPMTWTDFGTAIDIDLGLGQGTNIVYTSPNGVMWNASGGMVINGQAWSVSGVLNGGPIVTGQGVLNFTPVPEPGMLFGLFGGLGTFVLRRRKR